MICYICKTKRGKPTSKNYPVPVAREVMHKKKKMRELIGYICKVCVKKAAKIQRRINAEKAKQRQGGKPIILPRTS